MALFDHGKFFLPFLNTLNQEKRRRKKKEEERLRRRTEGRRRIVTPITITYKPM